MSRRYERKVCSMCRQEKPVDEKVWKTFKSGKRAGRPQPFCVECSNRRSREFKQAQRDAAKQPAKEATRKRRRASKSRARAAA